jgi:hypothetical protein
VKSSKFILFLSLYAFNAFSINHAKWTEVLKNYVSPESGFVFYEELKADALDNQKKPVLKHKFNEYLYELKRVPHLTYLRMPINEKKAFLINAYNALTIELIILNFPIESIKDLGSFWTTVWKKEWPNTRLLEGKIKTLDALEHEYLRHEKFSDPRIHAALNCASYSCPKLRREAFEDQLIDKQLDDQMIDWLQDSKRNSYLIASGILKISKIFKWFMDDFDKWGGGVKKTIEKYGPKDAQMALQAGGKIDHLDYNWSLNIAPSDEIKKYYTKPSYLTPQNTEINSSKEQAPSP